jgi:sulfur relay protein TusB/DsrH
MESILLLLKNAPSHPDAATGLQMAQHFQAGGNCVDVFLLQDAVLAGIAKDGALAALLAQGLDCYALGEDLQLRGYAADNLLPGVRAAGYDELVEMMMERYDRVLGAL